MRGSLNDLPVAIDLEEVRGQYAEWGNLQAGFETYKTDIDMTPLLKGLPDDRCQCPHWGFVIKGRMIIRYVNREEVVNAGDAYYMVPGHIPFLESGTQIIEFSDKEGYAGTMEVISKNLEALQRSSK
jgi:hypothetical protein